MKVSQIYSIVNDITNEITGKNDLLKEDLSNIVDVGKELLTETDTDKYVKTLVDRIGKTIFTNREYKGKIPSVVMDSWEFGSVLQKITADLPQATENESWELVNGASYDPKFSTSLVYRLNSSILKSLLKFHFHLLKDRLKNLSTVLLN
jgi:hypothetical protein